MPIVTIQCLRSPDSDSYPHRVVQTLSDELGDIFGSDPGTTWVKLEYLDRESYAENRSELPDSAQPTFVEILKRSLPDEKALAAEAKGVSATVARVLDRPAENIHVIYSPEGSGRVAFGGNLIRRST